MVTADVNSQVVRGLDSRFPIQAAPALEKAVNFSESYRQPVHRWFRYREGFSPSMMDLIRPGERVYDPFCGCGTALIEAARQGIEAVGTDVNPLAVFVAATKSRAYPQSEVAEFSGAARRAVDAKIGGAEPPNMPLLPKLFLPDVLDELLRIKASIDDAPSDGVSKLLQLAWLSILEDCSNVFKEGNGLKYRSKRRAPGKYVDIPAHIWIGRHFGSDVRAFVRDKWNVATAAIHKDLTERSAWRSPEVIEASCLGSDIGERIGTVDTAIFSPPYANRFDYFEAFKVELWMGGFVADSKALATLRKRSMRNNLTVRERATERYGELETLLDLMDADATSVRMGIKETMRGYFEDVQRLAVNLHACLRPGGRSICVVGNSAYAGVLIPTDSLCAQIFEMEGFRVEAIRVARHLTVSPQQRKLIPPHLLDQMRESVVICSKL